MLLMTSGVYSAFFGLFILTLLAVRDWLQGGKCQSKARMDGKVVVITGANAGIGYETAKDLSMRGAKVIMGSRNLEKSQKAAKKISDLTKNSVTRKKQFRFDFTNYFLSESFHTVPLSLICIQTVFFVNVQYSNRVSYSHFTMKMH